MFWSINYFCVKLLDLDLIKKYFPDLTELQLERFHKLQELYKDWNKKINVVSRKDIDELYLRHVLHSLGIGKVQEFQEDANILDVGTGGGFPGIPLAILFPKTRFHLVDSIGKKIKVVEEVVAGLNLDNVRTTQSRVEQIEGEYDFIVSRAVAAMPTFVHWTKGKIAKISRHELKNGIFYLKGGDLTEELKDYPKARLFDLSEIFEEDFFQTKKVVHLPLKKKH